MPALVTQDWSPGFRARLAALLGLDEHKLASMAYGLRDRTAARLFGIEIHRDFIMPARRRLCPQCLRVGAYHRMLWDFTVLTVCPVHAVRLVDRCHRPNCGHPLSWRSGSVDTCSRLGCNADIAEAAPQPVPPDEMGGARAVAALLESAGEPEVGPPGLGAADIILLATQLGAFSLGIERVGRPTWLYEQHGDDLHKVLDGGWKALTDWPSGFHKLLDRLWARSAGRRGRYGLRKGFGYLSHWLSRMSDEPWCRPVADAFSVYIARKEDFASTAAGLRRYGSEDAVQQRQYTMSEAARHLGVSPQTMLALAEREDLYLVRPSGQGAPSLLRADKVQALAQRKDSMLLKGEAEKLLGIPRTIFKAFEATGLLPVAAVDQRVTSQRQYRRGDLEDLIARLEATMPTGGPSQPTARLVPMTNGVHLTRNAAQICKAMLDGRLHPAAIDCAGQGLKRILVAKEDVLAALPTERETMSVVQAAHEMGMAAETMRVWIKRGFLQAAVLDDVPDERGLRVTAEALAKFRSRYGAAATIGDELGIGSGRWLTDRLAYYGVKPVSGPGIDGAQSSLFRRSDIPSDIATQLHMPKKASRDLRSSKRAYELSASIGQAASRLLKSALKRGWNDFRNDEQGIYVQVLTGKRFSFSGPYIFRLNDRKVEALRSARKSWVAFAFPERPFFLLVPWAEIMPMVDNSKADRHGIPIRADVQNRVDRFSQHYRPLSDQVELTQRDRS